MKLSEYPMFEEGQKVRFTFNSSVKGGVIIARSHHALAREVNYTVRYKSFWGSGWTTIDLFYQDMEAV